MARKKGKNEGYSYRPMKSGKIECRAYRDIPNVGKIQLSARGKTEAEARKNLEKKYAEMLKASGKTLKKKDYTVEGWFKEWLFTIMKPIFDKKQSDTTGWYNRIGKNFVTVIGKKKLKQLKVSDVQSVVNTMLKRDVQPKYIKEVVCLLSTCLNYAVTEGYMNPLDFSKVKRPKVVKKKKKIRNDDENLILTNYFDSPDFNIKYLPIKVMFDTGLRPEEVGGLNLKNVKVLENSAYYLDISNSCIVRELFDSKGNSQGRKKVVKDTKTEEGTRLLPIPTLADNIEEQKIYLKDKGYSLSDDEPLFRNSKGGRYTQESLRYLFNKLADELNIEKLGSYTLRHRVCLQNN